jgi:hypothetical protein
MSIDDAISNMVTRIKDLEGRSKVTPIDLDTLQALVTKYYTGAINISDYFKVGDIISNVTLSNGSLNEIVDLVVIGIQHDSINSTESKAALTLSQLNCLSSGRAMNSSQYGYTYAKYSTSELRTWINDTYYNALPSTLQSLIKTVDKTTAEPASSSEHPTTTIVSSTEKCFIPSCYEMFGTVHTYTSSSKTCGVNVSDGTQYEYYKITNNRLKYYGRNGTTFSYPWTRSGCVSLNGNDYFVHVYSDGSANICYGASNSYGVCPAFCI